jgi:chloramphenicol 3-O phosphotransferase
LSVGNIIFLNGTSSSGKTTLARELQNRLSEPYLHFSIDSFLAMLPEKYFSGAEEMALPNVISPIVSGMHRSIAAFADAGNNIIVDHVLQLKEWLNDCVNILSDYPVFLVGVHCPLQELERRESIRDREPGTARYQFDIVHAHGEYDVQVKYISGFT